MTIRMEHVSVRLGRDPEDFRRFAVTVQIHSEVKPGLKATHDIDPGRATNSKELLALIGIGAGACCEYLGEKYNDAFDLNEVCRFAVAAFVEECHLQTHLAVGIEAKIKRLTEHASTVLTDAERELLHKVDWALKHHEKLTPVEMKWVNECILRIHSSQLH